MRQSIKLKRYFKKKYNIEIETNKLEKKYYRISKYPELELKVQLLELKKLIEIYPKVFIKNSGLKKIYIFKDWWWKGKNAKKEVKIGGISYGNGIIGLAKVNHSFHHELYHCTDHTDNKIVGDDNHIWGIKTHGKNYKKYYGKNGFAAIGEGLDKKDRPKGFASSYGKYGGIQEDQAEIGEALMKNEKVLKLSNKEPKLKIKIDITKEFYYARSEGKMDSKFWNNLHSGKKIDENYWLKRDEKDDYKVNENYEKHKRNFMKINSISVIIPVYNEKQEILDNIISDLIKKGFNKKNIIIVPPLNPLSTKEGRLVKSTRSSSMNLGAKKATGDILFFLHCDTILPDSAFKKLESLDLKKYNYGGFYKKFTPETGFLKIISFFNNIGTKYFGTLLGDNTIFVERKLFEKLGGFPNVSLMEDVEFSKALKNNGRRKIIEDPVLTSSRKFTKKGVFKTFFFMRYIRLLYFFGVKTEVLERKYREF